MAQSAHAHVVLIEAEGFEDPGGWVVDTQFMDEMGSPFLLAHGIGEPVGNAVTTAAFPAAGIYRLWVRTRDWVAPWGAPGAPGRFQVVVDGRVCPTVFGTEGADWHWQDGGMVSIAGPRARVELRDLTGFEGRCDALLFCSDPASVPPNDGSLDAFRRRCLGLPDEPEDAGSFDLVVVGAGIAGVCAALSAARLGLTVALVQDRPVVGGNNSSEVRVWLSGEKNKEPYPRIGDVVEELEQQRRAHYGPDNTGEIYEDERKLDILRSEENITLFLGFRLNGAQVRDGRIQAAVAQDTRSGRRVRLAGRWFADCTGDGDLGFRAGADWEMTIPGHMGPCNLWNVLGTGAPVSFPRCPWAVDLSEKPFPGREVKPGVPDDQAIRNLGSWVWESGFSRDPIREAERIRDLNFRAMYGAWDALKNVDGRYPTLELNWSAYIAGKRESRRLLGDVVLTQDDLVNAWAFEDACFPCTWKIDLHVPREPYNEGFEGDEFISVALYTDYPRPYWAPYRCLYSRNVANLFMGGRDISVTHEALGAVRVMRTGGMMGEIVGMAASLCREHDTDPRGVYREHLEALKALMRRGVGRGG